MTRLVYVVSVAYVTFIFDDAAEAIAFAQKAKNHYYHEDRDDKEVRVEVELRYIDSEAKDNKEE